MIQSHRFILPSQRGDEQGKKGAIIIVFRRIIRAVALPLFALPLAFLVGACQLVEAPTHITYTYSITSLPKDHITKSGTRSYTYKAGEQIPLTWDAIQGKDAVGTQPQPVRIDAGLVGPFSTIDALKSDESFDNNNVLGGRIAVTIQPIQTNNWTDKPATANLQLPSSLAPGYYMLVQRILVNKQGPPYAVPTGQIINIVK